MTQSNQSQNNDTYREVIEDTDLGEKSFFPQENNIENKASPQEFNNKEEVFVKEKEEDVSTSQRTSENVANSEEQESSLKVPIRVSLMKEEEQFQEVKEERSGNNLEEETLNIKTELEEEVLQSNIEPDIEINEKPEDVLESNIKEERSGNNLEEETLNIKTELKEEVPQNITEVKEEIFNEEEANDQALTTEIQEIPQVKESYQEIRDSLWGKVNPANQERFKQLSIEGNDQNKSLLNDVAVKITFLDDDLEDNLIKEEEAVEKIKELEQKIRF